MPNNADERPNEQGAEKHDDIEIESSEADPYAAYVFHRCNGRIPLHQRPVWRLFRRFEVPQHGRRVPDST